MNNPVVKLFLIDIENTDRIDQSCEEQLLQRLTKQQQQRFSSLATKRQRQYLYGRLLLSYAISDHHQVNELEGLAPVVVQKADRSRKAASTSISHTQHWVGLAYSENKSITNLGLDIELIRPYLTHQHASVFFSQEQLGRLQGMANNKQSDFITYVWTQKEAFFKSRETPIFNKDLKTVDFSNNSKLVSSRLASDYWLSIYCDQKYVVEPTFLTMNDQNNFEIDNRSKLDWDTSLFNQ